MPDWGQQVRKSVMYILPRDEVFSHTDILTSFLVLINWICLKTNLSNKHQCFIQDYRKDMSNM